MADSSPQVRVQMIPYPTSACGVFSLAIVGVTLVCLVYLILGADPENLGHLSRVVQDVTKTQRVAVNSAGEKIDQNTYQIAFWTPSESTVNLYQAHDVKAPEWEQSVEKNPNLLSDFGSRLMALQLNGRPVVNGYRRTEVIGNGRSSLKAGCWWVVSVDRSYQTQNIVNEYRAFWKPPADKSIYVEITTSGGDYAK